MQLIKVLILSLVLASGSVLADGKVLIAAGQSAASGTVFVREGQAPITISVTGGPANAGITGSETITMQISQDGGTTYSPPSTIIDAATDQAIRIWPYGLIKINRSSIAGGSDITVWRSCLPGESGC